MTRDERNPSSPARFARPLHRSDLEQFRAEVCEALPQQSDDLLELAFHLQVIEHFLGHKWVHNRVLSARRGQSTQQSAVFLSAHEDAWPQQFLIRFRLKMLALALLETQDLPGSAWKFSAARSADALSAWWELQVGWAIRRNGIRIGGLPDKPSSDGQKIHDYSVQIGDQHIAVEAKAIEARDAGEFRLSQIRHRLEAARTQLPTGGPGMVWLLLPWPFSEDAELLREAHTEIFQFLGGTRRINAVVVAVEQVSVAHAAGGVVHLSQRICLNERPNHALNVEPFRELPFS